MKEKEVWLEDCKFSFACEKVDILVNLLAIAVDSEISDASQPPEVSFMATNLAGLCIEEVRKNKLIELIPSIGKRCMGCYMGNENVPAIGTM